MALLSASATFTVQESTQAEISQILAIGPPLGGVSGTGRIVHPTLGTYDYPYPPDEWVGFGATLDIAPLWQSERTLAGAASTVWSGTLKDDERREIWSGAAGLAMPTAMLETLLAFFQQPPDPGQGEYLLWYPNYVCPGGFQALMIGLTVGGEAITRDVVTRQAWVAAPVTVTWRVHAAV